MRVHVAIAHTPELLELLRRAGADTLTAELPENLGDYLLPEEVAEETEVLFCELPPRNIRAVSYTHLDVYKRQRWSSATESPPPERATSTPVEWSSIRWRSSVRRSSASGDTAVIGSAPDS